MIVALNRINIIKILLCDIQVDKKRKANAGIVQLLRIAKFSLIIIFLSLLYLFKFNIY